MPLKLHERRSLAGSPVAEHPGASGDGLPRNDGKDDCAPNAVTLNVLLVDDHAVVREGLRAILEAWGEIRCVQAESAEDALQQLDCGTPVDVVLLDINLPGMNGLDALAEIHRRRAQLPVLLLSMYPEEQYAVRALRMGAAGYLSKSTASSQVLRAVQAAARGETYVTHVVALQVARAVGAGGGRPLHEMLSNREFEIFRMLGAGKPVSVIGRALGLSVKTVSTYRERILNKLNLTSNFEVIRYVLQEGLLE